MYQASVPRGPHDDLLSAGSWRTALQPGGAHGCRLKSWGPSRISYADLDGSTRDARSILSESCACGRSLSHNCDGKWRSVEQRPAMK